MKIKVSDFYKKLYQVIPEEKAIEETKQEEIIPEPILNKLKIISCKLTQEQIDYLKQFNNSSEVIRYLIDKEIEHERREGNT